MTGSSKLDTYSRGLGAHVRRLRKSVSLTQEELAKRTGLSADTIRRLEVSSFSPTLATLFRIAAAFGQKPAQLLAEMEENVWPMFAEGKLSPRLEQCFPIGDAEAAFAALASNTVSGKLALVIDADLQ